MDLKSGYPFWAVRNGLMHAFPRLERDLRCDIAVVGGGITGALIADELARHGHDVAVFEQRDVAWGSTAASTALLQYEIDTHMVDLARKYGEAQAVLAYKACAAAIPMLGDKARELRAVDFVPMDSVYYASKRRHARILQDEFTLRRKHGFDVEWLDAQDVGSRFGIEAPAAILSKLAASVDPYRMAYRLLARLEKTGAGVFDRTVIDHIATSSRGVVLRTTAGEQIRARHVVMAAGYANQRWLDARVARNRSSYAFITDPIDPTVLGPLDRTMLWESARPYLYMRATADHRLLVGGEDDAVDIPARRDARVGKKAAKLLRQVSDMFPRDTNDPRILMGGHVRRDRRWPAVLRCT